MIDTEERCDEWIETIALDEERAALEAVKQSWNKVLAYVSATGSEFNLTKLSLLTWRMHSRNVQYIIVGLRLFGILVAF